MNLPNHYLILLLLLLFSVLIINSSSAAASKCQKSFNCSNVGALEFPLAHVDEPACGFFTVDRCDSADPRVQFEAGGNWYEILRKESTTSLFVRDHRLARLLNAKNCNAFSNFSLPKSPHASFLVSHNLTFVTCRRNDELSSQDRVNFQNLVRLDCPTFILYYPNVVSAAADVPREMEMPSQCSLSQFPRTFDLNSREPFDLATADFKLEWRVSQDCSNCYQEGGQCGTNTRNEFLCKKGRRKFKVTYLIGGIIAAIISTFIILILFIWRKHTLLRLFGFQKTKSGNEKDVELFLKKNRHLVAMRFTYSDIKKMTKSFNEKLGQGGYGSVFKGRLSDRRLVAVKILNQSKGNGEEFMNEVASISKTSHINIVTLLGFCFEGTKRALIYEFMPNGSLEKYLQKDSSIEGGLGSQKLFEISLGIARGLEYLHQGCNTRILHFDIKPHNILLDKDFNPKISDFGLAKLCPNRSSIVSMLVARGTIGYIAPEVFYRNLGEVSHKSDVYSYGMMVLEIAGERGNINWADVDSTSEIDFPESFYEQLEMEVERYGHSLHGIMNESEIQLVKRKLTMVGLWCIQTNPRDRPSMTKVLAMLEGELTLLDIPPKPYLYSSPRLASKFSLSNSTN